MNQGMNAENVHGNKVSLECNTNVQELIAETGELNADMGPEIMAIGQSNMELDEKADKNGILIEDTEGQPRVLPMESSQHMDSNGHTLLDKIGPNNLRPKGMWTRINRMELGLGEPTKASNIHALGKRNSREVQEGQVDIQDAKRGKMDNDDGSTDYVSARVEDHPCREP